MKNIKDLSKDELISLISIRNSKKVNENMQRASACICGLGGLGSNIAISLTRLNIKKLTLIDYDIVDFSNLNRQHYFLKHIGMKKIDALKEQILQINPFIELNCIDIKLTPENIPTLLKEEKIICEAFDDDENKAMLVNEIIENFNDKFIISASGMSGIINSNSIKTHKIGSNLYICGDLHSSYKKGKPLTSPGVLICAAHESNMVLHIINNIFEV